MKNLTITRANSTTQSYTVKDDAHAERLIDRLQAAAKSPIVKVELAKVI